MLLKKDGIRVNVQNERGETPMYIAALKGYNEICVLLIAFPGIDVNAREFASGISFECIFFYKTALHVAAENNHILVVRLLLNNEMTEINLKAYDGIIFYLLIKLLSILLSK